MKVCWCRAIRRRRTSSKRSTGADIGDLVRQPLRPSVEVVEAVSDGHQKVPQLRGGAAHTSVLVVAHRRIESLRNILYLLEYPKRRRSAVHHALRRPRLPPQRRISPGPG